MRNMYYMGILMSLMFALPTTSAIAKKPTSSCTLIGQGTNPNSSTIKAGLPTTNTVAQQEQYFYMVCQNFGYTQTNCLTQDPPVDVGLDGYISGVEYDFYQTGCGQLVVKK